MPTPSDYGRKADEAWESILGALPQERMAVIRQGLHDPNHLIIERASPTQLAVWPELEGSLCYSHVNAFDEPCEGCPVLRALQDGRVHFQEVVSPTPVGPTEHERRHALSGGLVYAALTAIPLEPDAEIGEKRALELWADTMHMKRETVDARRRRDEHLFTLASFIEAQESDGFVDELIVYDALARNGLDYCRATLLVFGGEVDPGDTPEVVRRVSMADSGASANALDSVADGLGPALQSGDEKNAALRMLLRDAVAEEYTSGTPLEEEVSAHIGGDSVGDMRKWLAPFPTRLGFSTAGVGISGHHGRPWGVLLVERAAPQPIREEDLEDLGMYALLMNRACANW